MLLDWNCKESTNLNKVCGNVKDVSKIPGTMNSYWPWFATIYQFNEGLNHQRYKSGGSVISIKYILTSVNALFYEGRLLKSTELRVYVSRTNLIPRENPETFKMYTVIISIHD